MRRGIVIITLVVSGIIVILGVICWSSSRVNMEFATEADAYFFSANTAHHLKHEEVESLKSVLNGKHMFKDNPSCGFDDTISIVFNKKQTFCIARDTCPIIYWKEQNRYIRLSEEEKIRLYTLLAPYGFYFPCV